MSAPDPFYFNSIDKPMTAEHRERGSRFVALAFPVTSRENVKEKMLTVKTEHPKATHYCFGYRLGLDGTGFRVSDDGEPSGTAGRPILGQIDSRELTNTLVVVVRYFGGTLLGVPGLITAYKTAASLVLQVTPVVRKALETEIALEFDYTALNEVMTLVKQKRCSIIRQDIQLFSTLLIGVPKIAETETLDRFSDIRGLTWKRK